VCRASARERVNAACENFPVFRPPRAGGALVAWNLTLRIGQGWFQFERHLSKRDPLVQQMKKIAGAAWALVVPWA